MPPFFQKSDDRVTHGDRFELGVDVNRSRIRRPEAIIAITLAAILTPLVQSAPAQAAWAPGWNNLWVRAACVSRQPNPADNLEYFNVWAPNSPQGDKRFDPPDTGLGAYTQYYHYDNVNKTVYGD